MQLQIETNRLLLRAYELSDFDDVHAYAQNAAVMQFQEWGPNTRSDTIKFIQECIVEMHHQPRLQFNFGIELKKEKKLIGGCGAYRKKDHLQKVNIGYILNPMYWRAGYATEAVGAMIEYLQPLLNLTDISASCDKRNIASRRLLEKLGFKLIETIIQDFEQKGFWRDTLVYQFMDDQASVSSQQ